MIVRVSRFSVLVILVSLLIGSYPVQASDITGADYCGDILTANNGTAVDNGVGAFDLDIAEAIAAGMIGINGSGVAIRDRSGQDVPFQLGLSGNPSLVFIGDVGDYMVATNYLYSHTATGGESVYFPDMSGLEIGDDPTLEFIDNGSVEFNTVYLDGAGDFIYKAAALRARHTPDTDNVTFWIATGANTTTLYPSGNVVTNIESVTGAATHWQAVKELADTSYVYLEQELYQKDTYTLDNVSDFIYSVYPRITGLTVYYRIGQSVGGQWTFATPALEVNGITCNGTETSVAGAGWSDKSQVFTTNPVTGDAWTWDEINDLNVSIYLKGDDFGEGRCSEYYIVVSYVQEDYSLTGTGITEGEHSQIKLENGPRVIAENNVLDFSNVSNSYTSAGNIGNGDKFWISFFFIPDETINAASGRQITLSAKWQSWNEVLLMRFEQGQGKLRWTLTASGASVFDVKSTQTSWTAGTLYHVIASTSNTSGSRLRINGGTAVTSSANTSINNTGSLIFGDAYANYGNRFNGKIMNVVIGNDDLTPTEELALYNGITPGDETELWYMAEGSGAVLASSGSVGTNMTRYAGTSWTSADRPCKSALFIDGETADSSVDVTYSIPDTSANWTFGTMDVTPYFYGVNITRDGTLAGSWIPEYSTTFSDQSGNGNTGCPGIRTTGSDNLTSTLTSFTACSLNAGADSSVNQTGWELIGVVPTDPGLTTELNMSFFGAGFIEDLADDMKMPVSIVVFTYAYGLAIIAGFIVFALTYRPEKGAKGSLLLQAIVSLLVMLYFTVSGGGVIPPWSLLPFGIEAVVAVMFRGSYSPW